MSNVFIDQNTEIVVKRAEYKELKRKAGIYDMEVAVTADDLPIQADDLDESDTHETERARGFFAGRDA